MTDTPQPPGSKKPMLVFVTKYLGSLKERTRREKDHLVFGFDWVAYNLALAKGLQPIRLPFFRDAEADAAMTKSEAEFGVDESGEQFLVKPALAIFPQSTGPVGRAGTAKLKEPHVPSLDQGLLVKVVSNCGVLDPFRNACLQYERPVVGVQHAFQRVEESLHLLVGQPILRRKLCLVDTCPFLEVATRRSSLFFFVGHPALDARFTLLIRPLHVFGCVCDICQQLFHIPFHIRSKYAEKAMRAVRKEPA